MGSDPISAVVVALVLVAACKAKHGAPPAPASEAPRVRSTAPPPALPPPALPGSDTAAAGSASALPVIDSAQVAPLLPQLGAELAPLRPTSDGRQLHASWCVRDASEVTAAIERAGWRNVESRGSGPRTGVSADRDGYRLSLVLVPSRGTACTGLAANATIFRAPEL